MNKLALVVTPTSYALLSVTDLISLFAHEMSSVCGSTVHFSDTLSVHIWFILLTHTWFFLHKLFYLCFFVFFLLQTTFSF